MIIPTRLVLASTLIASLFTSCENKTEQTNSPSESDISAAVEARAAELIAEREYHEELTVIEASRIAEERENLAMMAAEKRGEIAADLSTREGALEARRMVSLEEAATEMARREIATEEVKEFVDSIEIIRSRLNETVTLRINGDVAKTDMLLISPAGYTVRYKEQDEDYFIFEYADEAIQLSLKRPLRGLSFATVTHKQPLAEGVPADSTKPFAIPSSGSTFRAGTGLTILSATYGAQNTHRDVKEMVKAKIQNGRLEFSADSGELGGDPIFGQSKEFRIKYFIKGKVQEKVFREGQLVSIP